MEPEQIEQKIDWLDQQRRKDADALERFEHKAEKLERGISELRQRMEELSADLARLSSVASRITDFDDSLHRHRQEISRQMESAEERRREIWSDVEELRRADQEALGKRVDEVKQEVGRIEDFEESLSNRREEQMRLSRAVDEITKRIEDLEDRTTDQSRAIETVQDDRRSDTERINDLQTDISTLRNKAENIRGAMELADDRGRRLETEISELSAAEQERRESLEAWTETQRRKLVEFERQWSSWEDHFGAFEEKAEQLEERMVQYEGTFRDTRQLQSELKGVIDRLERRINEVTEMQRLTEERMKQEWSAFKADDQKRWNTYKLTNDEQWREHTRAHKRLDEQLVQVQQEMTAFRDKLDRLAEAVDRRVRSLLNLTRDWASELEDQ